jgi:hypothetical protein
MLALPGWAYPRRSIRQARRRWHEARFDGLFVRLGRRRVSFVHLPTGAIRGVSRAMYSAGTDVPAFVD